MKIAVNNNLLHKALHVLLCVNAGLFFLYPSVSAESKKAMAPPPVFNYGIVDVYPHDEKAFTQGLVVEDGFIYEGTGRKGQSALRQVRLKTGDVLKAHKLPQQFFGEGIVLYKNKIIQLTWKSHVGFIYDKDSFKMLNTFYYPTEGWGITYDGKQLIMSDGTSNLYFLDPETLKETHHINVRDQNVPVTRLNELEYVRGEVFANVWLTNRIARIDPKTGMVTGWIDLAGLSPFRNGKSQKKALNGIAYDAKNNRLFVTGKLWPKIYEIKLVPAD